MRQLKPSSHLLRHALDQHEGETLASIEFGMEVAKYTRTSFERQILESVCIQQNTHHNLLNSRSEYNRCSLPRLSTRLGDSDYKKFEKDLEEVKKKEEALEQRIRDMRKTRNKARRPRSQKTNPPAKKRRTGKETSTRTCSTWETTLQQEEEDSNHTQIEQEKRKEQQEAPENSAPKRQKVPEVDIRKYLTKPVIETVVTAPTDEENWLEPRSDEQQPLSEEELVIVQTQQLPHNIVLVRENPETDEPNLQQLPSNIVLVENRTEAENPSKTKDCVQQPQPHQMQQFPSQDQATQPQQLPENIVLVRNPPPPPKPEDEPSNSRTILCLLEQT
jgi:hypothetical protein